eukprot:2554188-Pleurochrysis_carterae.AAC.1
MTLPEFRKTAEALAFVLRVSNVRYGRTRASTVAENASVMSFAGKAWTAMQPPLADAPVRKGGRLLKGLVRAVAARA